MQFHLCRGRRRGRVRNELKCRWPNSLGGTAQSALTKMAASLADSGGRPRGAVYHSKWGSSFFPAKIRETIENDVIGASPSLHSKWDQGWGGIDMTSFSIVIPCYTLPSPPPFLPPPHVQDKIVGYRALWVDPT